MIILFRIYSLRKIATLVSRAISLLIIVFSSAIRIADKLSSLTILLLLIIYLLKRRILRSILMR